MSLTNPVLNDIIIKELDEISSRIKLIEKDIYGRINTISIDKNEVNSKIIRQDCKIDVIHKLFNSLKTNNPNVEITRESLDRKKLYSEIETSINDKYSLFVERVMTIVQQYNTQQDHNISVLNNNYNNINDALNNMRMSVSNMTKNVNDIIYRLNGLEKKFKYLDENLHSLCRKDDIVIKNSEHKEIDHSQNQHTENNDVDNWVKVVKNRKHSKPVNYYNNRY